MSAQSVERLAEAAIELGIPVPPEGAQRNATISDGAPTILDVLDAELPADPYPPAPQR